MKKEMYLQPKVEAVTLAIEDALLAVSGENLQSHDLTSISETDFWD